VDRQRVMRHGVLPLIGGPFPPRTPLRTGPAQIDTRTQEIRPQAKAPTLTTSSSAPLSGLGCRAASSRPFVRSTTHDRSHPATGFATVIVVVPAHAGRSVGRCVFVLRPASTGSSIQAAWPPGRRPGRSPAAGPAARALGPAAQALGPAARLPPGRSPSRIEATNAHPNGRDIPAPRLPPAGCRLTP
jgi:hypothetical protein